MDNPNELRVSCPACGAANTRTAAQIRAGLAFACDGCGKAVEINKDTLLRTIDETIAGMRASLRGKVH